MSNSKQITKFLAASVGITGFTTAGGTSDTITQPLTTALGSAGDNGVGVPVQVGNRTQEGVITTPGLNVTQVYDGVTGLRVQDASGNDVYGKITSAGSTWTISYFSAPGGTEGAYTMVASKSINFEVSYSFSFVDLPWSAILAVLSRHVAPDVASFGTRLQAEILTVTATNALSALSQTYKAGGLFLLVVNGFTYSNLGTDPACTVSGTGVNWKPNSTFTKFNLTTDDNVFGVYQY